MGILKTIKSYFKPQMVWGDSFLRMQSIGAERWAKDFDRKLMSEIFVSSAVGKLIKNPVAYFGIFSYLDEDGYVQCQMIKNEHVWKENKPSKVVINKPPFLKVK